MIEFHSLGGSERSAAGRGRHGSLRFSNRRLCLQPGSPCRQPALLQATSGNLLTFAFPFPDIRKPASPTVGRRRTVLISRPDRNCRAKQKTDRTNMNEHGETMILHGGPGARRKPKPENRWLDLALHLRRTGTSIRNVGLPAIPGWNPPSPVIIPVRSSPDVFWSKTIQSVRHGHGLDPET